MTLNQGQENAILNKALSPVPVPHLTGAELNADISLGNLVFNTIDVDGIAFILTGIDGWLTLPDPQFPEVSRGIQGDGDYDVSGRYQSRLITLAGSILVPDRTHVPAAQQKLVTTIDLVRRGAWLKFNEDPTRAVFVRLNGQPSIETVNARGRIDFSIGLKAADPIKYEWNSARSDGYFLANVKASNYDNSETGTVTINNKGNYSVSGIYEVTGPIIGPSAAIFNNANADLITFAQPLRPRRELAVTYKAMASGVATLILNTVSDLQAGDEVYTRFLETSTVATASRTAGSSVVAITTTNSHGYSTGDRVVLSGVDAGIDNVEYSITRSGDAAFSFTTVATTSLSSTTGTVFNITNDRYNGTFFIDSVNTISNTITYTTIYSETYTNVQAFLGLAVRSADVLEIDTYNQEVAVNGETFQQRAKLATLIDWTTLAPGDNEVSLDDSNQSPIYVYKVSKGIVSTPVTLTTSVPHGFNTTDVVLVSDVPSISGDTFTTTTRKTISSYSRSGTTLTLNSTSHGFSVADIVVISGVDAENLDGEYTVASSATNSFTVTTTSSATVYTTTLPTGSAYAKKIIKVLQYSRSGYVANVVTTTAHGLNVNNFVNIYGISSGLDGVDGLQKVTAVNVSANLITFSTIGPATIPTTNVTGATVARRFPVTATTPYSFTYDNGGSASSIATTTFGALVSVDEVYATPSSITKSANVVTVTTTRPHGFEPNNLVQVENVGAGFNAGLGDPVAIANVARTGTTLTVRTAAAHALVANDIVQIYGTSVTEPDVFVDGTYSVQATANTTHFNVTTIDSGTINLATQERAFAADKIRVAYYTKNAGGSAYNTVAGTTVWFYTKTNHNLVTGDYVYVENVTSSINGLQGTVTNVNATFFTIVSDNLSLVKVAPITAASSAGNIVTVTATSHGFTRDTVVWMNSNKSAINGARTVTFANTTHFQFDNLTSPGSLTSTTGYVGRHYETSTIARAYPITTVPNATTFTYNNQTGPATNVTNQINGTTSNTAGEVVLNGDGRMSVYYRSGWIA